MSKPYDIESKKSVTSEIVEPDKHAQVEKLTEKFAQDICEVYEGKTDEPEKDESDSEILGFDVEEIKPKSIAIGPKTKGVENDE